ncbi:MAG: aminopeptidase [Thermomicrobiales bacterium]
MIGYDHDPRWRDLAGILTGHATGIRPGDRVLVAMREPETFPLAAAVHEAAIRAGGYPQTILSAAAFDRALLLHGDDADLSRPPDLERLAYEWADVAIVLRGARNPHEFAGISAGRMSRHRAAQGAISAIRTSGTRWTLVRVPNESFAQSAGMPLDEAMAFFFAACLRDWDADALRWRAIAELLAGGTEVTISGAGIDLRFSTAGRRWVLGDGRINIPDGEIYTAPVDDSLTGHIWFDWPQFWSGQSVEGIRLRFERGLVVEATAARGEEHLLAALAMDDGACRAGEIGLGVNEGITRPVKDLLFDEKIFGTVHLALGRAYAECGGVNHSALHWDLVKDLREGGQIAIDGRPVFAEGRYLLP